MRTKNCKLGMSKRRWMRYQNEVSIGTERTEVTAMFVIGGRGKIRAQCVHKFNAGGQIQSPGESDTLPSAL